MGPRNLLIMFFSTVAVSLVILIIFFSLFFKSVDLNFNTRLPDAAPDIGGVYRPSSGETAAVNPDSKADGLLRSTVHVPPEFKEHTPASVVADPSKKDDPQQNLPPVSDDAMLDDGGALPPPRPGQADGIEVKPTRPATATPVAPTSQAADPPPSRPRPVDTAPAEPADPMGPPVPPQGNAAPAPSYRVVMGTFGSRDEADSAAARASHMGLVPIVRGTEGRFTVQVGSFSNRQNAEALAQKTGAVVEAN